MWWAAVAWLAFPPGLASAALPAQVVERVSVGSDGQQSVGVAASGFVNADAVISADGRVVAFDSTATNLDLRATNGLRQIYVHDRVTRLTTLVTVSADGQVAGNGESLNPALSADGRFVAFQSRATNLGPCVSSSGFGQIFVRDLIAGTTECASVAPDGVTPGDFESVAPTLSADGRVVAFVSRADNLVAGCINPALCYGIMVRDRTAPAGVATKFADSTDGVTPADTFNAIAHPALSADGRLVAFDEFSTTLDPKCSSLTQARQIFVRDRVGNTIACVSLAPNGITPGNDNSAFPALSADGKVVVFNSFAANLTPPVCTNGASNIAHVFTRVLASGATACMTVGPDGTTPANGTSNRIPALSADGRFVTFNSLATNLVPTPVPAGIFQIYIRDRLTSQTTLVSVGQDGSVGNADSFLPTVTGGGDGRYLAFGSLATNLLPGDTNGIEDAFVARLALGPNWLVTGSASGGSTLQGFDALGQPTFLDFNPGFTGGVQVALGDVNGDGAPDLIVGGSAPGPEPRVHVYSGSQGQNLLVDFNSNPSNPNAPGGVHVAACDLEQIGRADIITGPGPGGGTTVRVWRFDPAGGTVTQIASFAAYASSPGGVFVACGQLDGRGSAPSLITGPGPGSPPLVHVFTMNVAGGTATERLSFLAYPSSFTGGVSVAAGFVRGPSRAAIVTGPGPGFAPVVRVWTLGVGPTAVGSAVPHLTESVTSDVSFETDAPSSTGVTVSVGDSGGGSEEVITGGGPSVQSTDTQSDAPQPQPILSVPPAVGAVVPTAPPGGAAALQPLNFVGVQLNNTMFQPGDPLLQLDVKVANPVPADVFVDVYLAIFLPTSAGPAFGCPGGDALVLVTTTSLLSTCLSAPQTFQPFLRNAVIPASLPLTTLPGLFATAVPPGVPTGTYLAALALTQPDTLNVIAVTFKSFVIVP